MTSGDAPIGTRLTGRLLVAVFAGIILSSCTKRTEVPAGLEGRGTFSESTPVSAGRPCNLLTSEEVQLALNAPSVGFREQGRPLLAGMKICAVNTPDGSELVWGLLSESAPRRFRTYERVNRQWVKATEVDDEKAIWDKDLGMVVVLTKRRALAVKLSLSSKALEDGVGREAHLEKTTELLAIRALGRL